MQYFVRLITVVFIYAFAASVLAQTVNSPSIISGYTPAGAGSGGYPLDSFASVSEFSGGLSFVLPLSFVRGRGETSFPLDLRIEADHLIVRHFDFTPPQDSGIQYHQYSIGRDNFTNVKQSVFSPGVIVARRSGDLNYSYGQAGDPPFPGNTIQRTCMTLSRVTFIAPDGSETEMRDRLTNGARYGENFALNDESTPLNRGRIYDSKDGSLMTFVSDTDVVDPSCLDLTGTIFPSYLSGTLYLPNGSTYVVQNGNVASISDRNGNRTLIEYSLITDDDGTFYRPNKITDSLGRETSISYTNDLATISEKGVGGRDKITKVHYGQGQLRGDQQLRSYRDLFPDITRCGSSNGCSVATTETYYIGRRINSVELPDGRSYQLYYDSYGALARVELPTGGAYEYDYTGQFGSYNFSTGGYDGASGEILTRWSSIGAHDWAISRRVSKQRTYNLNNQLESEISYDLAAAWVPGTDLALDIQTKDSAGKLLIHRKEYFKGAPADSYSSGRYVTSYNPQFEGHVLKSEIYDKNGSLLRVTDNTWEQTAVAQKPENERIGEVKTTLSDANLVAKKSYGYDGRNNLADTYEYDFDIGQVGLLKRHTHTDYLGVNPVNGIDYTSDNVRLHRLPSRSWISSDLDGTTKASLTIYEYDNYGGDSNHSPLTIRSSVSGFDSTNFGTSYTIRGNVTSMRSFSNAASQTGPVTTYSQYDVLGNAVMTIDANGNASTIGYADNFGAPDGEATTNSAPSQLGGLSTFAFATSTTTPPPFNWTAHVQYDYFTGAPVNTQDINGVISKTIYNDALNRPTQTVVAIGTTQESQTTIGYYDSSHYIQKTSDLNMLNDNLLKSVSLYDGLGRTTEIRSYEANGNYRAVQTQYDALGRAYMSSNPFRPTEIDTSHPILWTTSTFDALGRMIEVETPDGAKVNTAYDGNRSLVSDQAGKKRISKTNALGQLTDVWEVTASDGSTVSVTFPGTLGSGVSYGYQTSYSYDTLNNLLTVVQGSQTRTFTYNSLSRLLTAANPESGTISYDYDSNGNLTQKDDARGVRTAYVYDTLNRVTSRNYSTPGGTPSNYQASPNVTFTYDDTNIAYSKGRLTSESSSVSTTEYTALDILGRVTASKQITDGVTYGNGSTDSPMTYSYNLGGALVEQQYPSGRVVKNVLDNNGDLSIVESKKNAASGYWHYADSPTYNAAGALTSLQLGNGHWESTTFNNRLQPTQIALGSIQNGYDKLELNYTYESSGNHDDNGDILTQTITVPGMTYPLIQAYTYDSLNRLGSATETSNSTQTWKQEFNYDRYGNRNFLTGSGHTTTIPSGCGDPICNPTVSSTTNRLTSSGYSYDSSGNTTADAQSRTFVYDGENKQTSVSDTSGTVGQYYYDGDGRRVKKYVPATGETTIFVYDVAGKQIAEYSTIVANSTDAKVNYLTNDHLGSPRINTDANGAVISRHDYHPFGEEIDGIGGRTTVLNYGDDTVRKQFTGYEHDTETDLDFAQARMYAHKLGRFCSPDNFANDTHIFDPESWNLFVYVRNNPLHFTDPSGRTIFVNLEGKQFKYLRQGDSGVFVDSDGHRANVGASTLGIINNLYSNGYQSTIDNLIEAGNHYFLINESDSDLNRHFTTISQTNTSVSVAELGVNTLTDESTGESTIAVGVELLTADWLQTHKIDAPYAYSMEGEHQWQDTTLGSFTDYERMRLEAEASLRGLLGIAPESSRLPIPIFNMETGRRTNPLPLLNGQDGLVVSESTPDLNNDIPDPPQKNTMEPPKRPEDF